MAIVYDPEGVAGKVCNKCGEWKPVSEFHRCIPFRDGYRPSCKSCFNMDKRTYYAQNSEPAKTFARTWRQTHREQHNEQQRRYRAVHRERYNLASRSRARTYSIINPERKRESLRVYRQHHPDKIREASRLRRARKHDADGSHTESEWILLKAAYDYTCLRCGRREPVITLTRDHVIPLSQGGSDWITNIQPLCHSCNSSKKTQAIDYRVNWKSATVVSSEIFEDQ